MPTLRIDNTPATFQFNDSHPMSDDMAHFAASIINAGPAAARIRQQREDSSVAKAFQQAQSDRADRSLDLQSLWHQQSNDMNLAKSGVYQGEDPALVDLARQVKLAAVSKQQGDQQLMDRQQQQFDLQKQMTQAQMANMQADNARQALGQFGDGLNEAIKRGVDIAKLFQGKRSTIGAQPRVYTASDPSGRERFYALDENGNMRELPMMQSTPGGRPAPGAGAPPAPGQPTMPATPSTAPAEITPGNARMDRQKLQRIPFAVDRATKTLSEISARVRAEQQPAARDELLSMARDLANTINRVKSGDEQAMLDLWEWDAGQPDTMQQQDEDARMAQEMEAGLGAMR